MNSSGNLTSPNTITVNLSHLQYVDFGAVFGLLRFFILLLEGYEILGWVAVVTANALLGLAIYAIINYVLQRRGTHNRSESRNDDVEIEKDERAAALAYRSYRSKSCGPVLIKCNQQWSDPSTYDQKRLNALAEEDLPLEQESAKEYRYGGYKPIILGEKLGDRYEVLRKLGYGHFSTVWLCEDTQENENKRKYVAVKVVKSSKVFSEVARDEIRLLKDIMNKDRNHFGRKRIIEMLDTFNETSINGRHPCITFELMGPSLYHLIIQSEYCGLDIQAVKNIIRQVLQGLVYLHDVCHIIHTDLKPENILICVKENYIRNLVETAKRFKELGVNPPKSFVSSYQFDIDNMDLLAHMSPSESQEIIKLRSSSCNDVPSPVNEKPTVTDVFNKPMFVSPNLEVKIADLGNACWAAHPFTSNIQTKQYRALEVILKAGYSYPVDIWSVGCLAFELATGEYLFNPKTNNNLNSSQDHVLLIYELLNGIPLYIAQRGANSMSFFTESGALRIIDPSRLKIWSTEDVLVDKYNWKRVDAIPFAQLINSMIEPDPELRITAFEALQHVWLQDSSS